MNTEKCEGCKSLAYHENKKRYYCKSLYPFYLDVIEIESCPCNTCLIKGICITACDNFKIITARTKKSGQV
jgi:hypothetical protein